MIQFVIEVPEAELARKADQIGEAEHSGLQRVADAAQQLAERKVGDIRRRHIPSNQEEADYNRAHYNKTSRTRTIEDPTGPAWEVTGQLENAVAADPVWEGTARVDLIADVAYATDRHELGESWFPKRPALGIVRRNPFFQQTLDIIEPQVEPLFIDGFEDVWSND